MTATPKRWPKEFSEDLSFGAQLLREDGVRVYVIQPGLEGEGVWVTDGERSYVLKWDELFRSFPLRLGSGASPLPPVNPSPRGTLQG